MSPQQAETLAQAATQQWPMITSRPQLVAQRENIIFRVQTIQGDCALRLHRAGYHSEHIILSELQWMAMLAEKGFAVPKPATNTSGHYLTHIEDETGSMHLLSLLSWMPGQPLGKSGTPLALRGASRIETMAEVGKQLAKLHNITDTWQPPQSFSRPAWNREGLLGEAPFWGRFWESQFLTPEQRQRLKALRANCLEKLAAYESTNPSYGLIHADLARENILLHADKVSFIDYDDCGFGFRLFDIATALIKQIHEEDFSQLQNALLEGYGALRRLNLQDINFLPIMLVLRSLTYIGWVDLRLHEDGMREKAQRFWCDVEYLLQRCDLES